MYSAGIDLGGTFTKVALVASDGKILAKRKLPRTGHCVPEECFTELRREFERMASIANVPYPPPGGCGLGVPGVVNHETGRLRLSPPLGWQEIELGSIACAQLGCEVFLDIDVNVGALADLYLGCACGASEMIYVSWGTGIGAGFIVHREIYHSRLGAMGNFGHMPIDPESERLCYCGCKGCLEVEVGGKAMVDQVRERLAAGENSRIQNPVSPELIDRAAAGGDPLAQDVLQRAARLIARALAGVLAFLNPDTVVFGGGVSRCFPTIHETFWRELRLRTPAFALESVRIEQSAFGESAGVVGAAMLPRTRRFI